MKVTFSYNRVSFPGYRHEFEAITAEMQGTCPVAWSDTYKGHWVEQLITEALIEGTIELDRPASDAAGCRKTGPPLQGGPVAERQRSAG
jgi:hypothetical protein